MADWGTISALATAGGTLVLGVATFASVRSANRAARVAEQAFLMGQRPLVMPSHLDDPPEKLMWGDDHWAHVEGGRGSVELVEGNVYLAMSLRNAGNGAAVLQGWRPRQRPPAEATPGVNMAASTWVPSEPETFRPQFRDLYVPAGNVGFWQAAIRDPSDPDHGWLKEHIENPTLFLIELIYSDHEGGQRAIGLFGLAPGDEHHWICSIVRHWNLDRPNPR
jgi:hypothetical protein